MEHRIKKVYVVHHSHTDIGYTDLQERITACHVDFIRTAVRLNQQPSKDGDGFRWNCETYYCVERFLEEASEAEKDAFFEQVREGRIGISANYLNFNDLADAAVLKGRLCEMAALFSSHRIDIKTAMCADINGISMGQRDAMLENGVEFLFTNIHTHHGMYPLQQNQNAYWWENAAGQRLLVWNGEHYNLGNNLGIGPLPGAAVLPGALTGKETPSDEAIALLREKLDSYLTECAVNGYPYDFIVAAVSGVFSDNAPPNPDILRTVTEFNRRYGDDILLQMVSLQELYDAIRPALLKAPVLKGDLNDWWANGVGASPYMTKHYKEAQRIYHEAERLAPDVLLERETDTRVAQDNLLLFAEHTAGHSATITNPYDTMVLNLDARKNSYASKAHEAANRLLNRALEKHGDTMRYYRWNGKVKAIHTGSTAGTFPVEFYLEAAFPGGIKLTDLSSGHELTTQVSPHPRGRRVSFTDSFKPGETKIYRYETSPAFQDPINTRTAYVGAERVRDIVNDYDPVSWHLPYYAENDFFRISYEVGKGFTSFYNKQDGLELLSDGEDRFFTPIYENTAIRTNTYEERRLLGRNIRGVHAVKHPGCLKEVKLLDQGPVFTTLEFHFEMEGTLHTSLLLKLYRRLPRIDFTLRLAKTLSCEIESVYLPLTLHMPDSRLYLEKGGAPLRPGIDQLPGTCMEYYLADNGLVYQGNANSILIGTPDTALLYMGELRHHPIRLCDNKEENNRRPVFSWIMNNTWETNFRMDLSGFGEFHYTMELYSSSHAEDSLRRLKDNDCGVRTLIIE